MIHPQVLNDQWLDEISAYYRKADKILIEKAIRALFLLEGLATSKLNFVFKGGTALMLINNTSKRLSIDIDIIIQEEPKNLDKTLQAVASLQGFTHTSAKPRSTDGRPWEWLSSGVCNGLGRGDVSYSISTW